MGLGYILSSFLYANCFCNVGVFAGDKRIPGDTFLGIYAGEILTDEVGEERGMLVFYVDITLRESNVLIFHSKYDKFGRTYLFDIDCHYLRDNDPDWQVKYVVDAYHVGNVCFDINLFDVYANLTI